MKNTAVTFQEMKANGEKISMLTCYDYSTAKLMEAAGINAVLVGDSLGNTMLGYPDTLSVTMEDMLTYGRVMDGDKTADEAMAVLMPGHVVTVEPGVYIPGVGGCRIEDTVIMTEDGIVNTIAAPKHLIEL